MSSYNLLDEKWIKVIDSNTDKTIRVSLIEVFRNASDYRMLSGEMKTQDFAMFRLLLSVLHTVFSRFNANGEPYECVELDDRYRQLSDVSEDDLEDYEDELLDTWEELWNKGTFPDIVIKYLEKNRDRFYFFDEKYPFYQVTEDEILKNIKNDKKPTDTAIKNVNRLISESNNKKALFSPKTDSDDNKNKVSTDELVRWIIMFQGYTGQADKTKLNRDDYEISKGWIYDIGGIYIEGESLFETLMLNLVLIHPVQEKYILAKQKPCFEYSGDENISLSFAGINNLAQLYTNWSRAVHIDVDEASRVNIEIVKMPAVSKTDNYFELMTIWRLNKTGTYKGLCTPMKHSFGKSLWRSFGLLCLSKKDEVPNVGIIDWLGKIKNIISKDKVGIVAVGMQDDGNATSWVPINEIVDELNISQFLLFDTADNGWTVRINDLIEETKNLIDSTFKRFLKDIKEIRNLSGDGFVERNIEEIYSAIDLPFKSWIYSLNNESSKDAAILEWRNILKHILLKKAKEILDELNVRDLKGIEKDGRLKNLPGVFNYFEYSIKNLLG